MAEKPDECECCGFETPGLSLYSDMDTTIAGGGAHIRRDFWFCDLCASTMTSSYHRYPNATPSNIEVMRAVCLVGNRVIAAIREGASAGKTP